jgi:hypothetical protein
VKRLLIGLAAIGILLSCAMPAFSDSSGAIAAHVQVASPCIIVTPSSIDFGTVRFAASSGANAVIRQYQIDPCGMSETILVRGTPATSDPVGVTWQPASTPSTCVQTNRYATLTSVGQSTLKVVTLTNQVLTTVVGSPVSGGLRLNPPCVGSDGAGRLMNFSLFFTATFA